MVERSERIGRDSSELRYISGISDLEATVLTRYRAFSEPRVDQHLAYEPSDKDDPFSKELLEDKPLYVGPVGGTGMLQREKEVNRQLYLLEDQKRRIETVHELEEQGYLDVAKGYEGLVANTFHYFGALDKEEEKEERELRESKE